MASRGVNKVILIGNIGQAPETGVTRSGDAWARISLATSEYWNDNHGQRQERTEWHRVSFFGKLAEIVREYVHKGSQIYVEGALRTRKYDKNGETRYATEVNAEVMQLLGSREASTAMSPNAVASTPPTTAPASSFDDDIPF